MTLSIIDRGRLRAKRAVNRGEPRSLVEVARIVRVTPTLWVAHVEYHYGRNSWDERVSFSVDRDSVTVTDRDYPGDRTRHLIIERGTDMPSFITQFLITGRW